MQKERITDVDDFSKALEELPVSNPREEVRFILEDDVELTSDVENIYNVSFVGDGPVSLGIQSISGKDLTFEKLFLKKSEESSRRHLLNWGGFEKNCAILDNVDGMDIRKCGFERVCLSGCSFCDISTCTGKILSVGKSKNIKIKDSKFNKGIYEDASSLSISKCEDIVVESVEFDYSGDRKCSSAISIVDSENVSVESVKFTEILQSIFVAGASADFNDLSIENCKKAISVKRDSEVFFDNVSFDDANNIIEKEDVSENNIEVNNSPGLVVTII